MLYRPPVPRPSRLAWLSRWVGALGVCVAIVAIIGFRTGLMVPDNAMAVMLASGVIGTAAIVLAAAGFAPIWEHGALGTGNVIVALIWGLVAVLPAGLLYWALNTYPALTDVSTDTADPPLYKHAPFLRAPNMNKAMWPTEDQLAVQREAYPDLLTRRYSLGSATIFRLSKKIAGASGWKIDDEVPAKEDGDMGRIEAVARGLISGSDADIVVRIYAEGSGTRIDLRSSSRRGKFDFGENANRIRDFLAELDRQTGEG
jgi:hypothetical protein